MEPFFFNWGGAIPNFSNFFRPLLDIQSVVQGGENDFSTLASIPIFFNLLLILFSITEIAGRNSKGAG